MSPHDVPSQSDLERKVLRILDDYERWAAQGIGVNSGSVRPDGRGIVIGVDPGDLHEARRLFEDAYGRVIEVVRQGRVVPA